METYRKRFRLKETDNTEVAAQAVLADLTMPPELRRKVRKMKSALSRTKNAVDMVGVAETKAIDTAFAGVRKEVIDSTLYAAGLVIEDRGGARVIVAIRNHD